MDDIQAQIRTYLTERGWDNLRPGDLAKSVSIEAAELLELFQWRNPTLEEVKADSRTLQQLRGELADVLIYALDMAVLLELDAAQIITDKLAKIEKKYPAQLMKARATKTSEPGADDLYLKIKHQHRRRRARVRET